MTEQEIKSGNVLIKIFMEEKAYSTTKSYHRCWDFLMDVVEKINKSGKFDVIIYRTACHVNDENNLLFETSHQISMEGSLIISVWQPIVQFIKWYNEQKK